MSDHYRAQIEPWSVRADAALRLLPDRVEW